MLWRRPLRPRPGARLAAAAGAAAVLLAGATAALHAGPAPGRATLPVAAAAPVAPEVPTAAAAPPRTPRDAPVRLRVDAVDVDLPVRPVAATAGRLDPPSTTHAYWIEAYGRPAPVGTAVNTVYLVAHSSATGEAAFDPLLDVGAGTSRLVPGDRVEIDTAAGTVLYAVTGTDRYPKGRLAGAAAVWQAVPDRLVLITCLQRRQGRSLDNVVVTATAVGWRPPA